MGIKLHRCSTPWKFGPCWRVQKALDEQGIDYEVVTGPLRPGKRVDLRRLTGQQLYPVIEFENGSIYRADSRVMAATIRTGGLDSASPAGGPPNEYLWPRDGRMREAPVSGGEWSPPCVAVARLRRAVFSTPPD